MACGYCSTFGEKVASSSELIDQVCEVDEPYTEMWLMQDFQSNKFWFEAKTVNDQGQESTVQTQAFKYCPWCGERIEDR